MTGGRTFPVAALVFCTPVLRGLLAGNLEPDAAAIRAGMAFVLAWGACTLLGTLVARYRSLLEGPPEQVAHPRRRREDVVDPAANQEPAPTPRPD